MQTRIPAVLLLCGIMAASAHAQAPRLVVHEWGTFTSFLDEQGQTITGINVDDEPVPDFVHRLKEVDILDSRSQPARWSQGAPICHPDVTMRLETPVLYFYPPAGWIPMPIDVRATFVGGWLTEYFPAALVEGANFPGALDATARGSLTWSRLRLDAGSAVAPPSTTEHVWLAPRKVKSAVVTSGDGREAEKYLFYRGVGHVNSPINMRARQGAWHISLREDEKLLNALPRMWLVEVTTDGRMRFQTVTSDGREALAMPMVNSPASPGALDALRRDLAKELVAQGLFADEAAAMLETWRLSYFESAGLRLFFILPQAWTDARLPLEISVPADVKRVMVGRVELVTAHQREVLGKLLALPESAFPMDRLYGEHPTILPEIGKRSHSDLYRMLGREPPESLLLYESLGRFRVALLAHEWRSTQDPAKRAGLERVMLYFSACISRLPR